MLLISTVVLLVGINVAFVVVTSLVFEADTKFRIEKLVAVVISLPWNTGTND